MNKTSMIKVTDSIESRGGGLRPFGAVNYIYGNHTSLPKYFFESPFIMNNIFWSKPHE